MTRGQPSLKTIASVIALCLGVFAAPLAAEAQQAGKVYRGGILRPAPDSPVFRRDFEGFRQILRENGYVEGANLVIEYRIRAGSPDELLALADELVRLKVDVIFSIAPAGVAARESPRSR